MLKMDACPFLNANISSQLYPQMLVFIIYEHELMVRSTFSSNPPFMDDPTLSHPFVNVRRTHDGPNPGDFCLNPPFFHTFHIALH